MTDSTPTIEMYDKKKDKINMKASEAAIKTMDEKKIDKISDAKISEHNYKIKPNPSKTSDKDKNEIGWTCLECTYFVSSVTNSGEYIVKSICELCGTPKHWYCRNCMLTNRGTTNSCIECKSVNMDYEGMKIVMNEDNDTWDCPACTYKNSRVAKVCQMCGGNSSIIHIDNDDDYACYDISNNTNNRERNNVRETKRYDDSKFVRDGDKLDNESKSTYETLYGYNPTPSIVDDYSYQLPSSSSPSSSTTISPSYENRESKINSPKPKLDTIKSYIKVDSKLYSLKKLLCDDEQIIYDIVSAKPILCNIVDWKINDPKPGVIGTISSDIFVYENSGLKNELINRAIYRYPGSSEFIVRLKAEGRIENTRVFLKKSYVNLVPIRVVRSFK